MFLEEPISVEERVDHLIKLSLRHSGSSKLQEQRTSDLTNENRSLTNELKEKSQSWNAKFESLKREVSDLESALTKVTVQRNDLRKTVESLQKSEKELLISSGKLSAHAELLKQRNDKTRSSKFKLNAEIESLKVENQKQFKIRYPISRFFRQYFLYRMAAIIVQTHFL